METGEPRSDVLVGEMIDGRYRLVERIGEGATGLVYRAVAEPGSVAVAVKILRPDVAGGEARRFEREAVAAGKVAHPNLRRRARLRRAGGRAALPGHGV